MEQITLPVSKLSYSSLTLLLRNPLIFKMQEVFQVYDRPSSVTATIGKAAHESLKFYYGGMEQKPPADRNEARGQAKEVGLFWLAQQDDDWINYGKEGTREDMLKGYKKAMDFYFAEEPAYHKILVCEEKLEGEIKTKDGDILPLPAVGKPDLVELREDGKIDIIDVKFVSSFTAYDKEDWLKIMQAQFMGHLVLATKGYQAERVIFRECKRTLNVDGKTRKPTGAPQIRDWVVPLNHDPYRVFFYNLFGDVVKFLRGVRIDQEQIAAILSDLDISPDKKAELVHRLMELITREGQPIFLPNIADMMDGEQAGLIYAQGLISSDMSDVEVVHKVRDVAFASKKFVASRLDSAINKDLLPEERIKVRLAEFGFPVEPVETIKGASVTQYRFKVASGVSMANIKKHKDDIARAIEAKGEVRIVAPIPGTSLVGVEVEAVDRKNIKLKKEYLKMGTLWIPIGMSVSGEVVGASLSDMPHLLAAGSTGSGKSILLHSIITALTKQNSPEQMELTLIDPKRVELAAFAKLPHLKGKKVVYEYEDCVRRLLDLVTEMDRRYGILEKAGKRDLTEYNASKRDAALRLPYLVAVVDEFADLILRSKDGKKKNAAPSYSSKSKSWLYRELLKRGGSRREIFVQDDEHGDENGLRRISIGGPGDFDRDTLAEILQDHDALDPVKNADIEFLVVRLAQMARATGIHLIIATQRPSVDVITGLIKANFPTRIALTTASPTDSVVILGVPGAEKLSGKGDMLFMSPSLKGMERLQGFLP